MHVLKDLIQRHDPSVLVLLETRLSGKRADQICDRIGFDGSIRSEAVGFSGGIWVLWRKSRLRISQVDLHGQVVTVKVARPGDAEWLLSAIYASPIPGNRKALWERLKAFKDMTNLPWLLLGDFNETRLMTERTGNSEEAKRRSEKFNNWITADMDLMDVGFVGPKYTWNRGRDPRTRSSARLDRGLCNIEWRSMFENGGIRHLPAIQSDHTPLLLNSKGFENFSIFDKPFRFQAAWLTHNEFQHFLSTHWDKGAPLSSTLSNLAIQLQDWNRNVFGNLFRRRDRLWSRIEGVQKALETRATRNLLNLEANLRKDLAIVLEQINLFWMQKARSEALLDGDRNTRFYHASVVVRRRQNRVDGLLDNDGQWIWDQDELQKLMENHIQNLYKDEELIEGPFDTPRGRFPEIGEPDMVSLIRGYTAQEIKQAIDSMGPLKAPGPDGFQAIFYQRNWEQVHEEVEHAVIEILQGHEIPQKMNETLLVLIPKVEVPENANQFRPISLCNVAMKIATKAMVARLKLVMRKLVAPNQSSFVPGRQITDNIVITQEVMHSMRSTTGTPFMAIKIDLEKAYDRIRWSFLRDTLMEARFPSDMVTSIMNCVTTCSMRILWNGVMGESFQPSRGVRQGDPLSPYLFVLCMERLGHIIEEAIAASAWKPISLSDGGPEISHLFFADDLILFAKASIDQIRVIKFCLRKFCAASGAKINFQKSKICFSNNTDVDLAESISCEGEIPRTEELGRYLGIPMLKARLSKDSWKHILERVDGKLAGWKARVLSLAGRITLAKSAIESIPYYTMQSVDLPLHICDKVEQKVRGFVWGSTAEKRKIHLLSWDKIKKQKSEGGLGMRSMRQANVTFMTKMGWRLLTDTDSLWSRVVRSKYCNGRQDRDMFVHKKSESNLWRGVVKAKHHLLSGVRSRIGDGSLTLFWDHIWVNDKPLIELATGNVEEADLGRTVAEYWRNGNWRWEEFSQLLPASELMKIAELRVVEEGVDDNFFWGRESCGNFSIKTALIIDDSDRNEGRKELWKRIWKVNAAERVRVFVWLVAHDAILTNENRKRRHLGNLDRCGGCNGEVESTLHLLRDCPIAKEVWNDLVRDNRKPEFFRGSLHEWLLQELNKPGNWPTTFVYGLWWLWKWRNGRVFGSDSEIHGPKHVYICEKAQEYVDLNKNRVGNHGRVSLDNCNWKRPMVGWCKLNSDGAFTEGDESIRAGGLIRNASGEFMQGFAVKLRGTSAFMAEAVGLLQGLSIARQMQIPKLEVEMDALGVVQAVTTENPRPTQHWSLISKCREILSCSEWEVKVRHISRQANQSADWMAHIRDNGVGEFNLFTSPPEGLMGFMEIDSWMSSNM